jgi:hypothetical protein
VTQPARITRQDIESRFRAIEDGVKDQVQRKKQTIVTAVGVTGLVVVVLVYLIGKRSGKKKTTIVEIRRV